MKKIFTFIAALCIGAIAANAQTTKTWDFTQAADVATASATVSGFVLGTVTTGTSTAYNCPASTTGTLTCTEWPEITFGYTTTSTTTTKSNILIFYNNSYMQSGGTGVSFTITGLTSGDVIYFLAGSKGATAGGFTITSGATALTTTAMPIKDAAGTGTGVTYVVNSFTATAATAIITETGGLNIKKITQNVNLATGINDPIVDNGAVVKTEYFNVIGGFLGADANALPNGIYIKKLTYENGAIVSSKTILRK